jgi:hypothetical protein
MTKLGRGRFEQLKSDVPIRPFESERWRCPKL